MAMTRVRTFIVSGLVLGVAALVGTTREPGGASAAQATPAAQTGRGAQPPAPEGRGHGRQNPAVGSGRARSHGDRRLRRSSDASSPARPSSSWSAASAALPRRHRAADSRRRQPEGPRHQGSGRRDAGQRRLRRQASGAAARLVRDRPRQRGAAPDRQLHDHGVDRADAPRSRRRLAAPRRRRQGIVTKWSAADKSGYGLFIDEDGRLALWLGDATGTRREGASRQRAAAVGAVDSRHGNPRPQDVTTTWYFVAAAIDAASRQGDDRPGAAQRRFRSIRRARSPSARRRSRTLATNTAPLLMAARWAAGRRHGVDRPLQRQDRQPAALRPGADRAGDRRDPGRAAHRPTRSRRGTSRRHPDQQRSPTPRRGKLHGTAVNLPMRAVTGHNWTGARDGLQAARRTQYGAIYFHDDDLEDARWEVGFEFKVPATLKSGVYAARLRTETLRRLRAVLRPAEEGDARRRRSRC